MKFCGSFDSQKVAAASSIIKASWIMCWCEFYNITALANMRGRE